MQPIEQDYDFSIFPLKSNQKFKLFKIRSNRNPTFLEYNPANIFKINSSQYIFIRLSKIS